MGQYWLAVNVDKQEYIDPRTLSNGAKLLEFAYVGNKVTDALDLLIQDRWEHDRVALFGDYADNAYAHEYANNVNVRYTVRDFANAIVDINAEDATVYSVACDKFMNVSKYATDALESYGPMNYKYIINHALNECVNVDEASGHGYGDLKLHPLTLLLAVGTGMGVGDYYDNLPDYDKVGVWSRYSQDLELTDELPEGYTKFKCHFEEKR